MSGRLLYLDDQPTIKKLLEDRDNCIKYLIPETNNLDFFLCGKGPSWGPWGPWGPDPMARGPERKKKRIVFL